MESISYFLKLICSNITERADYFSFSQFSKILQQNILVELLSYLVTIIFNFSNDQIALWRKESARTVFLFIISINIIFIQFDSLFYHRIQKQILFPNFYMSKKTKTLLDEKPKKLEKYSYITLLFSCILWIKQCLWYIFVMMNNFNRSYNNFTSNNNNVFYCFTHLKNYHYLGHTIWSRPQLHWYRQ